MKSYQFEELTAALSIIICLLAYNFRINWLFYIYLVKSILDTISAIYYAIKSKETHYTIPEIRKSLEPLINKNDLEFYLRQIKK